MTRPSTPGPGGGVVPGSPPLGERPQVSPFVDRVYARLPHIHRVLDGRQGYPMLRWLNGVMSYSGGMDNVLASLWGARPIGPASPVARGLDPETLAAWKRNRVERDSTLGDPFVADPKWLPWLAQIMGARLEPEMTVQEQRDTIRYATSGWSAGTPMSISEAARGALTGTRFSRVRNHFRPITFDQSTGKVSSPDPTMWDVTVITRTTETPSSQAVLDTVVRKGAKPAGVHLHHMSYEASWDTIEALRPTWNDWEVTYGGVTTWDQLEETGLTFADVPGNLIEDASYEEQGLAKWTAANGSLEKFRGGIDGFQAARFTQVTAAASGQVNYGQVRNVNAFRVVGEQDYRCALNLALRIPTTVTLYIRYWDANGVEIGSSGNAAQRKNYGLIQPLATASDQQSPRDGANWFRLRPYAQWTMPYYARTARIGIQLDGLPVGESVLLDAWEARRYTGGA